MAAVDEKTDVDDEKHTIAGKNVSNELGSRLEFDLLSVAQLVDPAVRVAVTNCLKALVVDFDDKKESGKAESWIEWARRLKYLKLVNTDVPDFILPKHCSGELIDVKVFCKRGPDDHIYDTHKAVRERVARGNCFLRITQGPNKGSRCILYALKKFTGGLGDDDDKDKGDNFTWKKYFVKPLNMTKKIVATRKANGEAAHLSCVEIGGQSLICAGSKNVHMLIRNRKDIAFYRGDRYRIAAEVCHSIMDFLDEMEPDQKQRLLNFLIVTRFTAVFEILSPLHQHVEDLSFLSKPILQFITWTKTELEPAPEQQLCTISPHVGIEIARALGLKTIEYETILPADLDKRMKQIRQAYQYEGEVLYFLDEQDCVIGMLKKKTVWYIICRALREKARNSLSALIKNPGQFSVSRSVQQVEKRLNEIKTWLGLSDEAVSQWKTLGVAFLKWCVHRVENKQMKMEDIGDLFPVTWKKHLEESGLSDEIPVECLDESAEDDGEYASQDGASASGCS